MAKGRIQLEVVTGGQVVETKGFNDDVIEIGKLSRSDLKLGDENISRRHARIEVDKDLKVHLVDLGSTNGTRLNGMRVNKALLSDGDEIEMGVTKIHVKFDDTLRKAAAAHAPSARTQLSREGFYKTAEGGPTSRTLALEAALLWEDSAIQVDAVRRVKIPVRLKAFLVLLFAIGPLELWAIAGAAVLLGIEGTVAIAAGAAGLGLAIYFMMDIDGWKQTLLGSILLFRRGEAIYVGETANVSFFLPSETIGAKEYPLIVPYKGGWALNLKNKEIKGDLLHKDKVYTIAEARDQGLVKGDLLPMQAGTKCRLRFGQFSMLLSYVPVPPKPKGGFLASIDLQELAYMAVSLFIHFGLLILFVYLQPEDDIQIRRQPNSMLARLIAIESIKEKEDEEEEEEEEELPEKVELPEEEVELDTPEFSITESEKLIPEKEPEEVKFNEPKAQNKPLTEEQRAVQKQQNMQQAKKTSERMIPQQMLAQVTGTNLLNQPIGTKGFKVIGAAGDGGEPDSSSVFAGDAVAAAQGAGYAGLDNFGGTQGLNAGGNPNNPGAKGQLVAGLGKEGKGGKGKRFGNVKFKETKQRAVVTTGRVTVSGGALTKAIIKKYINRQKGSIILCYKKEVQKNPDLEGKVVVRFTISPTGKVMAPGIRSSTLGNGKVENCITRRLAMWRFPAPQNAGAVRVSYPFLFRTR